MRIVVDHRERESVAFRLLLGSDIDVRVAHLSVGDYVIDDRLIVERKAFDDFVESVIQLGAKHPLAFGPRVQPRQAVHDPETS